MDSRPRLRSWAKWTFTATAVVLLAVTIASRWWEVIWNSRITRITQWHIQCSGGVFRVVHVPGVSGGMGEGLHFEDAQERWKWGWNDPVDYVPAAHWRCGFLYWKMPVASGFMRCFGMSLLNPLLVAAIGAALLWRTDRRVRRRELVGLCPECGYDHHGLTAHAPCPECGSPHHK